MKTTGYNSAKSWGIVAACCVIHCLIMLPIKIAGIFFVAFLDRYDTSRVEASLFIVTSGIITSITGPLIGFLGEILGIRLIILAGCSLAALGVGICYFAENILTVTVCLGLIYGLGVNMGDPLLPQAIKHHFRSNITNANGVFSAGSSIFTFLIIPVISSMLNIYGVSGGLLLLSGIMFHTVPMAMMLRDPKYKETSLTRTKTKQITESIISGNLNDNKNCNSVDSTDSENNLINNSIENNGELGKYVKSNVCITEENQMTCAESDIPSCKEQLEGGNSQIIAQASFQSPLSLKKNKSHLIASKQGNFNRQSVTIKNAKKYRKACKTLSLFKDPTFFVIMFCQSVLIYVKVFVSTIIIDASRDKGIPQNLEQFLIMFISIIQTVGYACLGWLTDKGYISIANYIAGDFVCIGLSCCAIAFSNNFLTLMFANIGFGLFSSAASSAIPSLVYEFVNEKMHTMAMASRLALYAPLSFTMAPLIGYFRGKLGSYDGALYFLAAISSICTVLLVFLPQIKRCMKIEISVDS